MMPHEEHCCCENPQNAASAERTATENEKEFLHQLSHYRFLPVARFTLEDSREDDFISTALAPVFIRSVSDSMEQVREAGRFLQKLEDSGFITLDYDLPLNGYGYEEYKESDVYRYFRATVAEGAAKPGYLGDTAVLELGSMALTEAGQKIAGSVTCHEHHHSHE